MKNINNMRILLLSAVFIWLTAGAFSQTNNNGYILINDSLKEYSCIEDMLEMEEFRNQVVFIDIWGVGCGPCMKQMEYL